MTGFSGIVDLLDSLVVGQTVRKHGPFWRGKTRDDFIAFKVFGKLVVEPGNPAGSNIVLALKGEVPFGADLPGAPDDAVFSRMPAGRPAADPAVIKAIEDWITAGCPEHDDAVMLAEVDIAAVTDLDHVGYWRAFDDFFLYHATDEVATNVGNFMQTMTAPWKRLVHGTLTEAAWNGVRNSAPMVAATRIIRDNHLRIVKDHYGEQFDEAIVLDSHWKFGGNLLPSDPQSSGAQAHTMNSRSDWVNWAPFIDTVLRDDPTNRFNLAIARGWQVGIVADGLLRPPAQRRIAIPDFQATDPNLKANVAVHYQGLDGSALRAAMATRLLQSGVI